MSWSPYLPGRSELRATFLLRLIEYRDGLSSIRSPLLVSRVRELADYDIFSRRQLASLFNISESGMKKLFKKYELPPPTVVGMNFDPSCLEAMHLQVVRKTQGYLPLPEITEQLTLFVGPKLLTTLTGIPKITYYAAKNRREARGQAL